MPSHGSISMRQLPACFLFLFAAVIIYALAGSPTPDHPGLVEMSIAVLLALSVSLAGIPNGLSLSLGRNNFLKALQILFITGLVIPTVTGIYLGNDRMLMARDLLAFAFISLPLFLSDKFKLYPRATEILCGLVIFAGLAFCVRTLIPAFNVWIPQGELLYLSNSPLALFAAVFLAGNIFVSLESLSRLNLFKVLASLTGLGILIGAMLLDVQRATIGAVLITWIVLGLYTLVKSPKRVFLPLILTGALIAALYPVVADALHAMAMKTAQVGLNARAAEARAVFDMLVSYPPSLVVGQGWGSVFASPAVGGLSVNYTHSLLTTMALKGGLLLFFLALIMVLAGLHQIFLIFQQDKVRALALFWSLVIPAFLYASHKSLDFGLILLLIGVWSTDPGLLRKSHSSGKTKGHPQEKS